MKLTPDLGPRVTTERIRTLFGSAGPVVGEIWESQFDGCDDQLARLARLPWDALFDKNFWVYFHDLTYVELQRDLFVHLFPACLVMAQESLMCGQYGLGAGDADFLNALASHNWTQACGAGEVEGTYQILVDGFLDRVDLQDRFREENISFGPTFESDNSVDRLNWIRRLNSLGYILPSIEPLWKSWWALESPGSAVAALEYAWSLAMPDDEEWVDSNLPISCYGGPEWEADGLILRKGWSAGSLDFFASTVNYDYLVLKVRQAGIVLSGGPYDSVATEVAKRLESQRQLTEVQLSGLVFELRRPAEKRFERPNEL